MINKQNFWSRFLRNRGELQEYPSEKIRWIQLSLLLLFNITNNFQRMKIAPLLSPVMDYYDISKVNYANLLTLGAVFLTVAPFLAGPLADRFVGRKNLIISGAMLNWVSSIALSLAPDWIWFSVIWIISNFFVGISAPAMNAALRDYSPRMSRGLSFGIFSIGFGAGNYLILWFVALLLPIIQTWQGIFVATAAIGFLVWLVLLLFMRDLAPAVRHQVIQSAAQKAEIDARAREMTKGETQANFKRLTTVLKMPRLWSLVFGAQLWVVAYMSISSYAPLFLRERFGMSVEASASTVSVFWPAWAASGVFWGWASDKLGTRKLPLLIGSIGATIGLSIIVLMIGGQPSATTITLVWLGLGLLSGPIWPTWLSLYTENLEEISPYAIATGFSMQAIVGDIGTLLQSFFMLRIVSNWGWLPLWGITVICCSIIPFTLIAGKGRWLPERFKKKEVLRRITEPL